MSQITLNDLVDYFDPAQYPVDPNTGRSDVPYEDVLSALNHFFQDGYSWKVVSQGFKPDGNAYVTIELNVYAGTFCHTCPGSAENEGNRQIGFAGLQQMALRNAVLRGLRMGEKLYQNKVATSQSNQQTNVRGGTSTVYPSNGFRATTKVWDGTRPLGPTSKKYAGKPYSSVEEADLEKWCNGPSPNPNAIKERQRRIDNGTWSMGTPTTATWANPAGNGNSYL